MGPAVALAPTGRAGCPAETIWGAMGMVAVMVPVGLLGDRVAATGAEQGKGATGDLKTG